MLCRNWELLVRARTRGPSTHLLKVDGRGWPNLLVQVSSGASQQGLCVLKPLPLCRPQFPHLRKEGLGCNDGLISNKEPS